MKLVSKSLADQVYDLVKEQILSGKIPCGSKISEDSLATQFGVSRTPIREALKRLSAYGIIQMEPRSHSSVISLSEKESQDIATFRIYLEDYAIDHIAITYDIDDDKGIRGLNLHDDNEWASYLQCIEETIDLLLRQYKKDLNKPV